jgi:hypothetical protein
MSVPVNIPEIVILRNRVEESFGEPLETHNGFIMLVGAIEAKVREHLSESTLERMWGYSTRRADVISLRTLNVLSQFVGSSSWKEFCADIKKTSPRESEEFGGESIISSNLEVGAHIRLGWSPDRLIEIEYQGNNRFVILDSKNSSLKPGDNFECIQIQAGRPLYLDRFRHCGSEDEYRYVAGERNGLTVAEVLPFKTIE